MKKQLLLGAMILCLAGSMTACSGTSKAAQDNKAQEKETYTLKVSHVQGDNCLLYTSIPCTAIRWMHLWEEDSFL